MRRPAVFLDRDGTILVEKDYLADPADAELIAGAAHGMRRLAEAGFTLVVVSNQSGIARGLYGEAEYRAVEARMLELLAAEGVRIGASYHCPHHPDFTADCDCRKPRPGMFQRAIREHGLDGGASWLVGDRLRDLEPGEGLGARAILVRTGYGAGEADQARERGIPVARDLADAAGMILASAAGPSA